MTNNSRAVHDAFALVNQEEGGQDVGVAQAVHSPMLALPFRRSRTYETPRTTNHSTYMNHGATFAKGGTADIPMKMKPSSPGIETVATDDSDVATTDRFGTSPTTIACTNGRNPSDQKREDRGRKRRWRRHRPIGAPTSYTPPASTTIPHRRRQLLTEFGPKLILEVMGGAGAVWGFSEICGLRTPATLWFWRPVAATVGFAFFLRFLHQLATAWKHQRHHHDPPPRRDHGHNHDYNNHDLELGIEMSPSTCSSADSNSHLVDSNPSPLYHRHQTSTTMSSSTTANFLEQPLSPNEWTALTATITSNTLSAATPMATLSTHNHHSEPIITNVIHPHHRGVTG